MKRVMKRVTYVTERHNWSLRVTSVTQKAKITAICVTKCDRKLSMVNLCDKCVTNTGKLIIINQLQMETIDIDLRVGRS